MPASGITIVNSDAIFLRLWGNMTGDNLTSSTGVGSDVSTYEMLIASAKRIDDTAALTYKFVAMGLLAVALTFVRAVIQFVAWNPLGFRRDMKCGELGAKLVQSPVVVLQIFLVSGAILFAGMAGECFSIPMDLLTSLINDGLSSVLRMPRHSFLCEYMVNLTISGFHVWNCLRLLGPRFNALAGMIVVNLLEPIADLTNKDRDLLKSTVGAHDIFDVKNMVVSRPLRVISHDFVRTYCMLFIKMFVFSVLARLMAFAMLWATTLVPLVMEPLFEISDLFFGFVFVCFGQSGAAVVAVAWSVGVGIVLGDKQSSSGGVEDKDDTKGFVARLYLSIYEICFDKIECAVFRPGAAPTAKDTRQRNRSLSTGRTLATQLV